MNFRAVLFDWDDTLAAYAVTTMRDMPIDRSLGDA